MYNSSSRYDVLVRLIVITVITLTISACHDANTKSNTNTGQSSTMETPPELEPNETYDLLLNPGVIDLDRYDEVEVLSVEDGQTTCGSDYERTFDHDALRFGYPCSKVSIDYSERDLILEEGDLIFSAQHQLMGRVSLIRDPNRARTSVYVEYVNVDDIFARLYVEATIPTAEVISMEEQQSELSVQRHALISETMKRFQAQRDFEQTITGPSGDSAELKGELSIEGQIAMFLHLGASVPEEEKMVRIFLKIDTSAVSELTASMTRTANYSSESLPKSFSIPLRFGLIFADLIFSVRAGLEVKGDAGIQSELTWSASESVSASMTWTETQGWIADAVAESEPWQTEASVSVEGEVKIVGSVKLGVGISLFKFLGAQVNVIPQVEAKAQGGIELQSGEEETDIDSEVCLKVSGEVGVSVEAKVRGMEDQELYENTFAETTIYERGACEDDEGDELPVDRDRLQSGGLFTCTSPRWKVCEEYFELDPDMADFVAQDCVERNRELSLESCDALYGRGDLIGTCLNDAVNRKSYFYQPQFNCLPVLRPAEHPMCSPWLEGGDDDPEWQWGPACPLN